MHRYPLLTAGLLCLMVAAFTMRWTPFVEPYTGPLDITWGEYDQDGLFCGLMYFSSESFHEHKPLVTVRYGDTNESALLAPPFSECWGRTCYIKEIRCESHAGGNTVTIRQETAANQPILDFSDLRPTVLFDGSKSLSTR